MAERIYRRGWRDPLPAGAVLAARPAAFGNPFTVEACDGNRQVAVSHYANWLSGDPLYDDEYRVSARRFADRTVVLRRIPDLAGLDLACYCPLHVSPCHVEVLLALANCDLWAWRRLWKTICTGRPHDPRTLTPTGDMCGAVYPGPLVAARRRRGWVAHPLPGKPPAVMCPRCARPNPATARLARSLTRRP